MITPPVSGPPFVKGEALGNDYLVLVADTLPFPLGPPQVRLLCDRHQGIGADGIVLLEAEPATGARPAVIYNPDGSTAELSGNGLRIAALAARQGRRDPATTVLLRSAGRDYRIRFDQPPGVTIALPPGRVASQRTPLEAAGELVFVTEVEVGNPHAVVEAAAVPIERWPRVAAALECHPRYPARRNVERIAPNPDGSLQVLLHERGVGPTAASGTGASAAALAARTLGLVAPGPVRVRMEGGEVVIDTDGEALSLTGPVRLVASGWLAGDLVARLRE